MAKKEYYPDVTIGAGYFPKTQGMLDMWNLTATINLPIYTKTKQDQALLEANALLSQAKQELQATDYMLASAVRDSYSMETAAERLTALYRDALIPKAQQDVQLGLVRIRGGKDRGHHRGFDGSRRSSTSSFSTGGSMWSARKPLPGWTRSWGRQAPTREGQNEKKERGNRRGRNRLHSPGVLPSEAGYAHVQSPSACISPRIRHRPRPRLKRRSRKKGLPSRFLPRSSSSSA